MLRRPVGLTAGLALGVLAAGCGGGSHRPSVASIGGSTTTTTTGGVAFARCMRTHGVPNFPDPESGGVFPSALDSSSPQFQGAQRACRKYMPAGMAREHRRPTEAQIEQMQLQLFKFAACVRSHGSPDFPDPQISVSGGRIRARVVGTGFDANTPQFQRAASACTRSLPGGQTTSTSTGH